MPRLAYKRVLILDRSTLAKNMYTLLFDKVTRFKFEYAESLEVLSQERDKPVDFIVANSNIFKKWDNDFPDFPAPTLLLISNDRLDLRNHYSQSPHIQFMPKPFYPYELLSEIIAQEPQPKTRRLAVPKKRGRRRKSHA